MGSILTLTCGHAALYPRGCRTEWEMENRRFVGVAPLQEARLTSAVRFACWRGYANAALYQLS
jgi:hypothetical protein